MVLELCQILFRVVDFRHSSQLVQVMLVGGDLYTGVQGPVHAEAPLVLQVGSVVGGEDHVSQVEYVEYERGSQISEVEKWV